MKYMIGIRREDKNKWERRVPLTPEHVKELRENHSVEVWLQPSPIRIFSDEEYI
jgi:alanine dehydrogenase